MNPLNELFEQALAAHQANDLVTAKRLYVEALGQAPQHVPTLHMLGLLAAQLGQFNNAIIWFEQALRFQAIDPILHNNLANAHKQLQQWDKAEQHYQRAIELNPNYCDAYNNLGTLFYKKTLLHEAKACFLKAVSLQDEYTEAHLNLGLVYLQQTEQVEAIIQFEKVLALQPNSTIAHWQLANLYLQKNALDKAAQHYYKLLGLQPRHLEALNNLGVLQLKQNAIDLAIDYFNKALQIEPKHADARNNLAGALLQQDRFTEAIWHYQLYLQLVPMDYQSHYSLGVAYMAAGYFSEALQQFKKIVAIFPEHADAFCNLAATYLKMGKKALAIENYQQVLQIQPKNKAVEYILNALTGKANPTAAPPEYIKNLFDSYAGHFDQQLIEQLHYQVPVLLQQALQDYLAEKVSWRILDLGCGSGLAGSALKALSNYLVGVDISPRMLAKAREKNIYDKLIEADLLAALEESEQADYDLVIAADSLVYFGDLKAIFSGVFNVLHAGGLFAFTIETGEIHTYQLMQTARYMHAKSYIEMLAKHFDWQIVIAEAITGRVQQGEPVAGNLFVFKKR